MASIEHECYINESPTEVFNFLCRVEEMPRYECDSGPVEPLRVERLGGVIGTEMDEGGLAVASIIRYYHRIRGQIATFDSELVEYLPGRIIAWKALTPPVSITRYDLTAQDTGTLLKLSAVIKLP
jgi:hypothetical protein